jgi:hypothetical protein
MVIRPVAVPAGQAREGLLTTITRRCRATRPLAGLGATIAEQDVNVPETVRGAVARFTLGDVVLLPGSRQRVPGRKIVGATVRVRDLAVLRRALAQGRREAPPAVQTRHGRSVFLAPDATHGIWLEFRETR